MDLENLEAVINGESNKMLTKKHIAERQRRARINSYLEEIQRLTSTGTNTAPGRIEKAEVLERAVSYIQNSQVHIDPNNNSSHTISDKTVYQKGFTSCMNKLMDQVSVTPVLYPQTGGLKRHLDNFLQNKMTIDGIPDTHRETDFCDGINSRSRSSNVSRDYFILEGIKREYDGQRKEECVYDRNDVEYEMQVQAMPWDMPYTQDNIELNEPCDPYLKEYSRLQGTRQVIVNQEHFDYLDSNNGSLENFQRGTKMDESPSKEPSYSVNKIPFIPKNCDDYFGQDFSDFEKEEIADHIKEEVECNKQNSVWRPW